MCVYSLSCVWLFVSPPDCSPPGSSVHGSLQARILMWFAIPFSRASSWPRDQTQVSCIAGRFFTIWATSEALGSIIPSLVLSLQGVLFVLDPLHFYIYFRDSLSILTTSSHSKKKKKVIEVLIECLESVINSKKTSILFSFSQFMNIIHRSIYLGLL